MNYTGFVKITKKFKKLHKNDEKMDAGTHTRIMAYVHEADFVKHESLLRLEQATQSLMARRFYNGNRELANAALRLKQNPPSDWHSFRQGMHLGVFLMLLVWTLWAARLLSWDNSNAKTRVGNKNLVKSWTHPAMPVYRLHFSLIIVEWCWAICIFVWNRYRVNYVYMMGLRPISKEHYQDAFESAINGSIVVMFDFLLFVKISEAEIPSTRWFSEGILPILLIPYLAIHFLMPLRHSTQSLLPALYACLISPFSEVTFFASFIGDWMVSLVRVFADFTYTTCYVGTGAFMSHRHIGEQVHMIEQCT